MMEDIDKMIEEYIKENDMVAIIRCKDCIHYEQGVCLKIYSDGNV